MKKTMVLIILATTLTLPSSILAKVAIKPLEPARGKVLLIYEVKFNKPGVTGFVFPPRGGLTSLDRKPILVSVKEKGSGEKLEAVVEPYIEGGRTIPGKYEFHIRLPKPLKPKEAYTLELKIAVFNKPNCYSDKTGRWVCEYSTQQNVTFLVPKGHVPVFSSHPVHIFEDGDIICLQTVKKTAKKTDKKSKQKSQTFVFKTAPPPRQDGVSTPSDTNDLITETE